VPGPRSCLVADLCVTWSASRMDAQRSGTPGPSTGRSSRALCVPGLCKGCLDFKACREHDGSVQTQAAPRPCASCWTRTTCGRHSASTGLVAGARDNTRLATACIRPSDRRRSSRSGRTIGGIGCVWTGHNMTAKDLKCGRGSRLAARRPTGRVHTGS
jgi:hypothetical protein